MAERYVIRPDPAGFSVVDLWAGEPAMVAMARQAGLSLTDAEHIAALLNQRAAIEGRVALPEPRPAKV